MPYFADYLAMLARVSGGIINKMDNYNLEKRFQILKWRTHLTRLLMTFFLGTIFWANALAEDMPAPGIAVIGGESFEVVKTAAERPDIKPHILPEMYEKCVDFAKTAHSLLASSGKLTPRNKTDIQLKATASRTNCERLTEIMLEDAAEEKFHSITKPIINQLMVVVYAGNAETRNQTVEKMKMDGWPTGIILMNPEDLGIDSFSDDK
jgi:hypothetical protein